MVKKRAFPIIQSFSFLKKENQNVNLDLGNGLNNMDKIKLGDYVQIHSWSKFYRVTEIDANGINLKGDSGSLTYRYTFARYSDRHWIIQGSKIRNKSGFGKFISKIEKDLK